MERVFDYSAHSLSLDSPPFDEIHTAPTLPLVVGSWSWTYAFPNSLWQLPGLDSERGHTADLRMGIGVGAVVVLNRTITDIRNGVHSHI